MKVTANTRNDRIKRINQIYRVLKKNDFGHLIEENTFLKVFPLLRNRNKEESDEIEESAPLRVRKVLEELGPAYIKFGQM